eukprot:GHVT01087034.1.p1 GENE.GHVT01087034.1~~GHVT01087034.1.p1  ORF type:complete len:177 (-),score=27.84 GHVT01087034.1:151-681(-)
MIRRFSEPVLLQKTRLPLRSEAAAFQFVARPPRCLFFCVSPIARWLLALWGAPCAFLSELDGRALFLLARSRAANAPSNLEVATALTPPSDLLNFVRFPRFYGVYSSTRDLAHARLWRMHQRGDPTSQCRACPLRCASRRAPSNARPGQSRADFGPAAPPLAFPRISGVAPVEFFC